MGKQQKSNLDVIGSFLDRAKRMADLEDPVDSDLPPRHHRAAPSVTARWSRARAWRGPRGAEPYTYSGPGLQIRWLYAKVS